MCSQEDYKLRGLYACLFGREASYRSQLMFRSLKYEVRMLEVNKLALSRDDDKRITVDRIASLARGHFSTRKNIISIYKMEPLTTAPFNPNMIKVVNFEQKKAGEITYTSVKFEYNGGAMPPLRIDGKFRLLRFKNHTGDIYSLSIRCNEENEPFFRRLCDAVA